MNTKNLQSNASNADTSNAESLQSSASSADTSNAENLQSSASNADTSNAENLQSSASNPDTNNAENQYFAISNKEDHKNQTDSAKTALILEMEKYWEPIPGNWKNDHLHKVFMGFCLKKGLSKEALRKYNKLLSEHPEYYLAKRYQQQLINILFLSTPFSSQTEAPSKIFLNIVYFGILIGIVLFFIGLFSPFWYLMLPGILLCLLCGWYIRERNQSNIYLSKFRNR